MEQNISYLFFTTIPIMTFILYLITESILIITIIGSMLSVFIFLYIHHANSRKETLNILRDEKLLHFMLSDDLLFSIKLVDETKLHEILTDTIEKEMVTIKDIVYRIDFVNFKNDALNRELNELIKQAV